MEDLLLHVQQPVKLPKAANEDSVAGVSGVAEEKESMEVVLEDGEALTR